MRKLTVELLEKYIKETYSKTDEQGLFIKLVEEVGEVAELINIRGGRKVGDENTDEELAMELADVIHYVFAIAAINDIDLEKTIIEKDRSASIKYNHKINLEDFLKK